MQTPWSRRTVDSATCWQPDGALFEIAGGPDRQDSFAHVHFYHEQPLCAANWYVEHLGMELPPL